MQGWYWFPRNYKQYIYALTNKQYLRYLLYNNNAHHSNNKAHLKHAQVRLIIKKLIKTFKKLLDLCGPHRFISENK